MHILSVNKNKGPGTVAGLVTVVAWNVLNRWKRCDQHDLRSHFVRQCLPDRDTHMDIWALPLVAMSG